MYSAREGHEDVVFKLLQYGGRPDDMSKEGGTALMAAASRGNIPIVKHLVDWGADPNKEQLDGLCALVYAAAAGFPEVGANHLAVFKTRSNWAEGVLLPYWLV